MINFLKKLYRKYLLWLIGEPRDPDERDIVLFDIEDIIKKENK